MLECERKRICRARIDRCGTAQTERGRSRGGGAMAGASCGRLSRYATGVCPKRRHNQRQYQDTERAFHWIPH